MKRLFIFLAVLIPMAVSAQEETSPSNSDGDDMVTVFAQIVGINKNVLGSIGIGNKLSVEVDFGDEKSFWGNDGRNILVDENGKDIKFNSMVDAMNFMGARGWVFEDSYVITVAQQNVIHWLLSKRIKRGEDSRGDMQQKRDLKKKKAKRSSDEYRNADPIYD